jgi:uncharacterized membrane protein
MGLDYLQKKNWHPGSIRNQEIVWIREELQKEIIKRVNYLVNTLLRSKKERKSSWRKSTWRS